MSYKLWGLFWTFSTPNWWNFHCNLISHWSTSISDQYKWFVVSTFIGCNYRILHVRACERGSHALSAGPVTKTNSQIDRGGGVTALPVYASLFVMTNVRSSINLKQPLLIQVELLHNTKLLLVQKNKPQWKFFYKNALWKHNNLLKKKCFNWKLS